MKKHSIAVIAGDGIGKEVVPAAIHVLDRVAAQFGFTLPYRNFDWSCETY